MRLILLALFFALWIRAAELPKPLPRAHAHNDYEHSRPLWDALEQGVGSVEADIHLVSGELLVAHDAREARNERTLKALYLEPLRTLVEKNGGWVYPGGPPLILLIDIKTEAESTYAALKKELQTYRSMLTRFEGERMITNAVSVILSGNRPRATLLVEQSRLAAFDGRLADLGQNLPVSFMPLVSDNWGTHFQWKGQGQIPEAERKKLEEIVARVHREKRWLRFWATPDTPAAWRVLHESGVDLLNTDNLPGLARFLRSE